MDDPERPDTPSVSRRYGWLLPLLVFAGIMALATWLLHFWTIRHMQEVIYREVSRQSRGKFALTLGSTHINYRTLTLVIEDARLEVYDSMRRQETAGLEVPRISLHFKSIVRFLLRQELALDTVICEVPSLTLHATHRNEEATLSASLGKAALALRQAAENLNIGYLRIRQGKLTVRPSRPGLYAVRLGDLNIEVDNFSADTSGDFRLLFADDIRLTAGRQRIVFADSLNEIFFREIALSTRQAGVTLDSCVIQGYRKGNLKSSYRFYFEQIRITHIDYGAMYDRNFIKADSLICTNPQLHLELTADGGGAVGISEKLTEQALKAVLGNLNVRFVAMENVRFDMVSRRGTSVDSYSTHGNQVKLFGLFADQEKEGPIHVDRVAFQVANYRRLSPDSLYRESFDSVLISNRDLVLLNYQFVPSEYHRQEQKRWIQVPRLALRNIELSALLFDRRVQANTVDLSNPFIRLSGGREDAGPSIFNALDSLRQRVGVERAIIGGGRLIMDKAGGDLGLQADGLNADIELDDLFRASSGEALERSVNTISCRQLIADGPSFSVRLLNAKYGQDQRTVYSTEAEVTSDRIRGRLRDVRLGPFRYDGSGIQGIGRISWESGNLNVLAADSVQARVNLLVGELEIGNTSFVLGNPLEGNNVSIRRMRVDSLQITAGQLGNYLFRRASGTSFSRRLPDSTWQVSAGEFDIRHDAFSHIMNVKASGRFRSADLHTSVPRLSFAPRFKSSLAPPEFDSVRLQSPSVLINLSSERKPDTFVSGGNQLKASAIRIADMRLLVTQSKKDTLLHSNSGELSIRAFQTPDYLAGVQVDFDTVRIRAGESAHFEIQSRLTLRADELQRDSTGNWVLALEQASLENARITGALSDQQTIDLSGFSGKIGRTLLALPPEHGLLDRMINEPSLELAEAAIDIPIGGAQLRAEGVTFTNRTGTLAMRSLRLTPDRTLEEFVQSEPFQKDYVIMSGGPVALSGFNVSGFLKDTTLSAERLDIVHPVFNVFRDKHSPREEGIVRPLPAELIHKLSWRVDLDTLLIRDAEVRYTETSEKSGRSGTVVFTNMDARIVNVYNGQAGPSDSLRLDASALLMDSALIRMNFRQSYADTLASFSFRVGMGSYRLPGLNPVTEPLANFRITDGQADRLQLRAVGNDYYTLGKVRFYYQNLGVEFLPDDPDGGTLFTGLTNFFTNSFVISRNNRKREGMVYFERNRGRSVFNYWLKITMSGILTSVGVKTNKSYMRNYRRNLRRYALPEPIE